MRIGFYRSKKEAQKYADKKNKYARTKCYKVVRVSHHNKPGFEKAMDGYEIEVTNK